MDILFLIGKILFGGYFIMSGLNHFMKMDMMVGYAASKKVPSPKFSVALSGLMLLLGGLGILLGVYTQIAVALLVIFLVIAAFKMHNFWSMEEGTDKMNQMRYFMSAMALVGAALMMLAISSWPLSL